MGKYFDRFPLIDYDGVPAKNILSKVDFTDQTMRDIYSNFNFVVQEGLERPDVLSYTYYNSSQYDWLIHLSNKNIDPQHDVYKNQETFYNYITKKYGSAASARTKVLYFRNNWAEDDRLITTTAYESLIADETQDLRKYWKPKLNNLGSIIGYERVQEDWTSATNKIIQVGVTDASLFNIDDVLYQPSTGAYGTVTIVDTVNSILTVQHIHSGEFEVSTAEGITSVTLIHQGISDAEMPYWKHVTAYEYEEEQNELKRYINMIKSTYLSDVEKLFIENLR